MPRMFERCAQLQINHNISVYVNVRQECRFGIRRPDNVGDDREINPLTLDKERSFWSPVVDYVCRYVMRRLKGRSHYNKSECERKIFDGNCKYEKLCSLSHPRFLVLRTNPEKCV